MSTPDITTKFGERLRRLRGKNGWTQVVMAERVGVDRSHISDMDRAKKNVCLRMLENLA